MSNTSKKVVEVVKSKLEVSYEKAVTELMNHPYYNDATETQSTFYRQDKILYTLCNVNYKAVQSNKVKLQQRLELLLSETTQADGLGNNTSPSDVVTTSISNNRTIITKIKAETEDWAKALASTKAMYKAHSGKDWIPFGFKPTTPKTSDQIENISADELKGFIETL
tara:strand:+ start:756 stop:1256 length:501 start_codon:yes stop_codon:yes gene_type:complete